MPKIIGQQQAINLLNVARRSRQHILLIGGPGRGKTTLSMYYLRKFDRRPLVLEGGDKNAVYKVRRTTKIAIFIDEVHLIRNGELLYPVMDRRKKVFALATTDQGDMPRALISRCIQVPLVKYTIEELSQIASQHARLNTQALIDIAYNAHGSPRRAKQYAELISSSRMRGTVEQILHSLGIVDGLNSQERELMNALATGPKGISTLCGILGVGKNTIKLLESDLIEDNLVQITSRGRRLTRRGIQLIKKWRQS